jgi:nucleoside-diphosphate-sugar epimerase
MKALILGATGMVGSEVLTQCLSHDQLEHVLCVGRRSTDIEHPKLLEIEHGDFLNFSSLSADLENVDVVFYCLGVYQAKVSKKQFWKITVDYLDALVQVLERANNTMRFCLFSAQGASASEKSLIRFAKAKGRAENILLASRLEEKYIFRPGYIMPGPASKNVTISARLFEPIYRLVPVIGIDASELARVMIDVGINRHDMTIFENRDLRGYGNSH